ncbi:MAG: GerMN domain-containing protein [Acidobacteriota bacterium]|nr:GerMN domain-containing protein [Acidobacteriota bacterium]
MIPRRLQYVVLVLVVAIFAMGGYLVHLKRKAEMVSLPLATRLSAPVSGPAEMLLLYVADDQSGTLRQETISQALPSDPGERGRTALHALIARCQQKDSPHPLPAGADVHEVFMMGPSSAVINLNAAFADGHRSGIGPEQLSLFSLVMTLRAQFPQLTRVRFLVEGKSRETLAGHVDLSSWYDTAAVAESAASLK